MAPQDWLTPATAPSPSPYQQVMATPGAASPAYDLRPLTLGEVLDRTFSVYRSRFLMFAGIAGSAAAVELVLSGVGRILIHRHTSDPGTVYGAGIVVGLVAAMVYFLFYCVTQAATCFAMAEVYLGRPASIGASLRAVRGKWYAWIGIAFWQIWSSIWVVLALSIPIVILATLRVGGGFRSAGWIVLLFFAMMGASVYGLLAYIRNSLGIPAKVVEGLSVRHAMRRSKTLAAGAKGRIFVLLLIVWVLTLVAGIAETPLALFSVIPRMTGHVTTGQVFAEMGALVVRFLGRALVTPVLSIGLCLIYFDQRVRREAFDLELLLGPEDSPVMPQPYNSNPQANDAPPF